MEAVQIGGVKTLIPIVRALAHPTWKDPKFDIALDISTRELFNVAVLLERLIDAIQAKQIQTAPDLKAISEFGIMIAFAVPTHLIITTIISNDFSSTVKLMCEGPGDNGSPPCF